MSVWSKTGNATWTKINSIFVKTGNSTWTETLSTWIKTGSNTWTKVFTRILVPANTVVPDVTGSTYLYGTLTGSLGTWTSPNGTNSYARQWQRASNVNGSAGSFGNISGATSSTYTTTAADDNKFISLKVTATNLSGSTTAQSYEYLITKYAAVALSTYSLSGSSIVGATLTALEQIGTWKGTTTITGDTSPDTFEYEWSWSDGTIRQSTAFNSINSNTYTIVTGDLGKIIRVRVTGTNSGGSDTTGYTSSGTVTSTYSFNFGNTLYVGSNGYIGLDSGGSTAASPGSGRIINIYSGDLVQYKLQEYSDSSNYYLYFRSYNYQSPLVRAAANAVDYQIKFYTGQPYCDIYIVRRGASVPTQTQGPGYYSSGFTGYAGIPGPYVWSAGSVLRSYFNGTIGSQSALTWTPISDSVWKDISNSDLDDSYTSVVAYSNQQAPVLTAPLINTPNGVTPGPQGGAVSVAFTGGSGPFYQIFWWGTATAPTTAVTPDGSGSSSPLQDPTGPTSTATQYMYVRSVLTAAETSLGPSSLASSWSAGVAFNMTSTAVSQSTAPTAKATSNNSTTIVKYGDSITWTSGTYTNQASKTSVLLYSTNTSNLVSPGGDTNTATRTSSPYTLSASDPTGTPYVFAVRDTVVGTNGTTNYFYSNQITSALADAVAFSYNAGVGAAGGWSATVVTAQSGASYSIPTTTGYSINSSTGTVTVTGLGSNVSSSITVTKSVAGTNSTTATASGTSNTVTTYTLTYAANGGSSTPTSQTGANGAVITLAANAGTRSGFSFGGWNIGGTTYTGGGSYTFGAANATATAIWTAVFVTPSFTGTLPKWNTTSPSNFQRVTSGTANFRWGWTNGTFTWSGSTSGSGGWNWHFGSTQLAAGAARTLTSYKSYTTTNDTFITVNSVNYPYLIASSRGDVTYSASARYASIQGYIFGTDNNEYNTSWTAGI